MPVYYDTEAGSFAIMPDECPDCETPWYDTGCAAPGCQGFSCPECGTGCDIEVAPDDGRCARAIADESDEDRDARINAERAAFGLPKLGG